MGMTAEDAQLRARPPVRRHRHRIFAADQSVDPCRTCRLRADHCGGKLAAISRTLCQRRERPNLSGDHRRQPRYNKISTTSGHHADPYPSVCSRLISIEPGLRRGCGPWLLRPVANAVRNQGRAAMARAWRTVKVLRRLPRSNEFGTNGEVFTPAMRSDVSLTRRIPGLRSNTQWRFAGGGDGRHRINGSGTQILSGLGKVAYQKQRKPSAEFSYDARLADDEARPKPRQYRPRSSAAGSYP